MVLQKGSRCYKCIKLETRLKSLTEQAAKKENILKSLKLKSFREKRFEVRSKVYEVVKETFWIKKYSSIIDFWEENQRKYWQ